MSALYPERDMCFDELAVKANHRTYPGLIYRKLHKHTEVGFKVWALCLLNGYLFDFEPSVIGHEDLTPRKALLLLCSSLPRKHYRLFADNLFVNIQTIKACFNLEQTRADCVGFPKILKEHSKPPKRNLDLTNGEYECMFTEGPLATVAVVWVYWIWLRLHGV